MAKGWLKIPGVQDGDRTLEEQMLGLDPALQESKSKSVLDLGCAEGLIALEFAKAGAGSVFGCDYNARFIEMANDQLALAGPLPVTFQHMDVETLMQQPRQEYDIVLALAILHKLPDPALGVKFCAQVARSLIVIRLPIGSTGSIRSKHAKHMRCDIPKLLTGSGFVRESKEYGPRGEWVQYWRRA